MTTFIVASRSRIGPSGTRVRARPPADAALGGSGSPGWRSRLGSWLANHAARRRLQQCAALDPRLAKDIGLTPGDIVMECCAPFWVPVPRASYIPRRPSSMQTAPW